MRLVTLKQHMTYIWLFPVAAFEGNLSIFEQQGNNWDNCSILFL